MKFEEQTQLPYLVYIRKILNNLPVKNTGSLQTKLFLFFFASMVLISCLVSAASYYIFQSLNTREIGRSRVDVLRQIGERTRVMKSSITTVSNLYYTDEQVYNAISKRGGSDGNRRLLVNNLKKIASKYQNAFEKINVTYYAVLIGENGFEFCSIKDGLPYDYPKISKMLWYRNVVQTEGKIFWVSSYDDSDNSVKSKYVFSAARIIKDRQTGERLGVLLINIEERKLFETYHNVLNGKNNIYIIDDKGSFVSHNDEHMLGINFYDMERFRAIFKPDGFRIINKGNDLILLSNYVDPETGWTIVEEIPLRELLAPLTKVKYTILEIFGLCILLSFVLSVSFADKTAKPLKQFCFSMEQVQKGDLDVISDIKGWNELKQLSDGFNQMVEKIKELIRDVKLEERLKRKAELDFLQAQINPHFLYNTLLSIKCQISMDKNYQAEQMLAAFMGLLERMFNNKEELITLAEEIECLQQYVLIQQYRYSHQFEVYYDLPPTILDCRVPKLFLQPLVENSIFHGIEAKQGPGKIVISAKRNRDQLLIQVIDDGAGMDNKMLKAIWENQLSERTRKFNGLGVINVHQRIQMHFGAQYGLKISSKLGKGTKIRINLPVIS